jgi:hypothetical protein
MDWHKFLKLKILMVQLLRLCIWFFIGYWILKRGWISILALFIFKLISLLTSNNTANAIAALSICSIQ